jgi:hypothetical protein
LKQPAGVSQHACPALHFAPPLQLHSPPFDVQVSPTTQSTPLQLQTPLASHKTPLGGLLLVLQRRATPLQLHMPLTHVLPLWLPQLLPQPPQCCVLVKTFVSQPLSSPVVGCEQLPNPGSQYDVQALLVHCCVATRVVEHVRLHPPQLATSS